VTGKAPDDILLQMTTPRTIIIIPGPVVFTFAVIAALYIIMEMNLLMIVFVGAGSHLLSTTMLRSN
jgi:hypothetical protein